MSMVLAIDAPLLAISEYARRAGITSESVEKQCEKGHLPFVQHTPRGTRYINMVQLMKRFEEANVNKPWN